MTDYYVDVAVGDDANAGTSEGAGNAWKTLAHAAITVIAGDTVYIKATGNYAAFTISVAGTSVAYISWIGYSTTTGDNGRITVDATGSTFGIDCTTGGNNYNYYYNIEVINATSTGWNMVSENTGVWRNCAARNNGGNGWSGSYSNKLYSCEAVGNGSAGAGIGNTPMVAGCIFADNFSHGCDSGSSGYFYRNVAYGNGGSQLEGTSTNAVFDNTCDGEGTTNAALGFTAQTTTMVVNNIAINSNWGIRGSTSGSNYGLIDYNLTHGNATADYERSWMSTFPHAQNDVTSDPTFTNEATHDYTPLDADSPQVAAGLIPGVY